MRTLLLALAVAMGLGFTSATHAQTPGPVTATCKDGSAFSGKSKRGACSGHGGVLAYTTPASPAVPATAAPAAAAVTAPATPNTATAPAAGARAGQVWVNTASKVYHCPGTRYFGKTKQGAYMTEAAAKAEGDRADHGKACYP